MENSELCKASVVIPRLIQFFDSSEIRVGAVLTATLVTCLCVQFKSTLRVGLRLKDGAYYCYCAYVLPISRYSDFLSVMLTNTGIFLRGLKLCRESRS